MRVHFRVTSPLVAFILILIGITRGWALLPLIGLFILFIIILFVCSLVWFTSDPVNITKEMIDDHNRIHSDYLVVDAHTKEIIRRYGNFADAKEDIVLWMHPIKNGRDFDGKTVYDCYFRRNGFENHRYKHYDAILYKEYDYNKERSGN